MPKIDLEAIPQRNSTGYPGELALPMVKRHVRRLARAGGLVDFGVSQVVLEPGGISSQRHWHEKEDEFVVVLEGEAVLVENEGETVLRAGDCAAFPKDVANGHQLVNRSGQPCTFLAIGAQVNGTAHYPDVDLHFDGPTQTFKSKTEAGL